MNVLKIKAINNDVIIMVDGGLSSQFNKFLIGQFLIKNMSVKVKYDLSWFEHCGKSTDKKNNRNFDLLKLFKNIDFPIATSRQVEKYKKYFHNYNKYPFVFNEELLSKSSPLYVDGYYSHWKYYEGFDFDSLEFSDDIVKVNEQNLKNIEKVPCSVALHIRRGDYVNSVHDVLDEKYYVECIKEMTKILNPQIPHFFIFSNDFEWVREKLLTELDSQIKYTLIEDNDNDLGYNDFYLISKCQNQICSNSGFAYFPAFLNKAKEKKVIIPKFWMKETAEDIYKNNEASMRYPNWIVIENNKRGHR